MPVHRILASRRKPGDPSVSEYKVQWDTSWEEASTIKGFAVEDWNQAINDDETFVYLAQDGGEWEVLKDSHCLENDSEDSQWETWVAIRRKAIAETRKN